LSLEDDRREYLDELELELEQVKYAWRYLLVIEMELGMCWYVVRVEIEEALCIVQM
jgi:hypothetical protein